MECLQYLYVARVLETHLGVLNLVINGMPSILRMVATNNTINMYVLNLVINGMPSIPFNKMLDSFRRSTEVLNLVINGMPSILNF